MKKLNGKGFTLIELLAVITIMGILMLVAIPAVSRTIENSRRDTFADVAKTYINAVRNSVLADELDCGTGNDKESVGATGTGIYYFKIDSNAQQTKDIIESGGKSSWSNARVMGYVKWEKKPAAASNTQSEGEGEGQSATPQTKQETKTEYSIVLVDTGKHGIDDETLETELTRASVKTTTNNLKAGSDYSKYPSKGSETNAPDVTECYLR